ncbi:MAG TPA: transporter substrate-binding domain-containing protein [Ramlibacter sp.]|jgi:polar amino acid transport system substrate-binding protein|uniref:transporter substrate-binding domain-containing protein n=1 Tax=Ramlibacter sp. TaxID=1917967 RepID=UPI002D3DBC79|nr:transporter substrate-binding domain-containing protein [Ramlibacter sp.]HZY18007.1 transporter substrate-binding domain-containing protein [Ramlibacter sp.]
MLLQRRAFAAFALATGLLLAGCAGGPPPRPADPAVRDALAPTGTLRVAVYPGSPTSLVRGKDGLPAGVAYELGHQLGRDLGVPVRVVEFARVQQVVEALKAGEADLTFTNATEARARDVDFTAPLVRLELGYLVPAGSPLRSAADIDRPGVRVGVSQGSSSQSSLPRLLRSATIVPVPSLEAAQQQLGAQALDAFATNKGILHELGDQLPGSRVLEGRWGLEQLAIAVPKGRQAAAGYLRSFALSLRDSGRLQGMVERAGLRGTATD